MALTITKLVGKRRVFKPMVVFRSRRTSSSTSRRYWPANRTFFSVACHT